MSRAPSRDTSFRRILGILPKILGVRHSFRCGLGWKMIPEYIKRQNVLAAMQTIDRDGIPSGRMGQKFEVRYEGRIYPPKLLVSLAHQDAKGFPLDSVMFGGGR